jgi:hypothetical protein
VNAGARHPPAIEPAQLRLVSSSCRPVAVPSWHKTTDMLWSGQQ